ncbi:MAG: hypothetical protein FJ299_11440 [Planctomycetes bacterium]|nr:hypothetical protein [Planctomycetota bacterium]
MAFQEDPKPTIPAWLVSFGDMMTLILTFFILLVSMARQRDFALLASGSGAFVIRLKSLGMPGLMSNSEKLVIYNEARSRFGLPQVDDLALAAEGYDEATALEVLRAASADALEPRFEIVQPSVAIFTPGTAELDSKAKHYLDLMAPTLLPGGKRRLVLEGHGEADADDARSARLALERAEAVRAYLIDEHDADPTLIHARGWLTAAADHGSVRPVVDARVLTESD